MDAKKQRLSQRVNEVVDRLIDEFPDEGFVLIATMDEQADTAVIVTSNLDPDDIPQLMDDVFDDELEEDKDLPAHASSHGLH